MERGGERDTPIQRQYKKASFSESHNAGKLETNEAKRKKEKEKKSYMEVL